MIVKESDIAGVVVLYNSDSQTLNNIHTYIDQIKKLYVVDNSTQPNDDLIQSLKVYERVHYHSMKGNKGIATALNWAANQAVSDGFLVILTMDDDTRTPAFMVREMITFWNQYSKPIGILSGFHHTKPNSSSGNSNAINSGKFLSKELPYTLTSGNLLNLNAYRKIGPFRDDFFIDHVDHEYGLRLNHNGFVVVELQSIRLEHRLGYTQQLKVGSYVISTYGSHSPSRLYYFARNGVYMVRQYFNTEPLFAWTVAEELGKRWIKALFLQDNRRERIKMLLTGIKHGWTGRLGKYDIDSNA